MAKRKITIKATAPNIWIKQNLNEMSTAFLALIVYSSILFTPIFFFTHSIMVLYIYLQNKNSSFTIVHRALKYLFMQAAPHVYIQIFKIFKSTAVANYINSYDHRMHFI